jgi:FlaG/FlaF family flagellin (archaellin)
VSRSHVTFAGVVLALVIGLGSEASAANPEAVFRGQIITSTKKIPTVAKSKGAYISALRKQKATRFMENKTTKSWKVYYTAFFRRPLNSLEVTVKIWDLSGGTKHLMTTFEQYMDKRGAKSITSHVVLERDSFGVNKNLMMTMESNGAVLAATRFAILGDAEKFSGQVNFSEEEAAKGSLDD